MKRTAAIFLGIAISLSGSIPAQAQSPAQTPADSQALSNEVASLLREAQSLAEGGNYAAAKSKLMDAQSVSTSQKDVAAMRKDAAAISAVKQFISFKARQLGPQL